MRAAVTNRNPFVVFPIAGERFAVSASDVVELARPGLVQTFPHTTKGLEGVLVRRGEVLPIWNVAPMLPVWEGVAPKYFLVARFNFAGKESTAIPVSGECQLVRGELLAAPEGSPSHVRGVLQLDGREIEVLDLARLAPPRVPTGTTAGDWPKGQEQI